MKKKIFLMLIIVAVFTCLFALSVSAATPDNTKETVTLSDGTQCALWDTDGDALIWYISGTDGNGANIYSYVKATSDAVDYNCIWFGTSYGVAVNQIGSIKITVNSVDYDKTKIVVLNIKDDVRITSGKAIGGEVNCFRDTFTSSNSIQYVYLPLNFLAFNSASFKSCPNLRYVNLEELTELRGVGAQDFNTGSSVFFSGQTLDLTKTKIIAIGNGAFTACRANEIKLPNTVTEIGQWAFQNCPNITEFVVPEGVTSLINLVLQNCTSLTTVTIPTTLTRIDSNIFSGSKALTTIKYVGEATEDYKALIKTAAPNATLEQTTWCEAYNDGVHDVKTEICIGTCDKCGTTVVSHIKAYEKTTISYTDFTKTGIKATACTNEGCTYSETEETPALFTCLGYSAPENGTGGIAIGFTVNNEAIKEYTEATGKTLKYGVFAVLQNRLGDKDIFGEDGTVAEGVINAEITNYEFVAFELKIVGFTDTQKDIKLAMGAYAAVTDGETTEYSYMQSGTLAENEKYCFVSYNDIVNPTTDDSTDEVVQ